MSHNIGRMITMAPLGIGPDHGNPSENFEHVSDPVQDTRFLILHFTNASFPASNSLEVDLGYGKDIFNASDGSDFWTRPININAFPDKKVPIEYITNGAVTGGVELVGYGRAQRLGEGYRTCTFTNCDLFLHESPYTEPVYDPFWICGANFVTCASDPTWKNYDTLPNDIRKQVGRATCMMISAHGEYLSTCSATLVGEKLVFLAGHCIAIGSEGSAISGVGVASASIVFDYETDELGNRPPGYAPKIFKVKGAPEYNYNSEIDYVLFEIEVPPGGTGITPLPMRTDFPSVGEDVFCIHHPNGAVKKFSPRTGNYLQVASTSPTGVYVTLDVAGGSSGSGLYDKFGNVVGTLSFGVACSPLKYYSTAHMLKEIGTTPPPPAVDRDVMIVLDRSGSMSESTFSGGTKIEEAKDAASLFITMIQQEEGHRIGLVSFSNTLDLDFDLLPNSNTNIANLVGPPPYSAGILGDIITGGTTSIGGGIDLALDQFSGAVDKDEVILLLTDGMQNAPPSIESIEGDINNRRLCIVGYGDETNLNGPLLASLAVFNDGSYTVAQDELSLKKFFAACFGDIFEAGFLMDPDFNLPRGQERAKEPVLFNVCGEESVTIVVGWDKPEASLLFSVETPAGQPVSIGDPEITSTFGRSWRHMRIKLPYKSEHDGEWKIYVYRPGTQGEFPSAPIELNYFVNVIAKGGPTLKHISNKKRYYTGDVINPIVRLFYPNNFSPGHGAIKVTVTKPEESLGNILTKSGLIDPTQSSGDTIPAINATLKKLASDKNQRLVTYTKETFELFDDGAHEDGAMEDDGIFGNPLTDLLKHSGVYTFHAQAKYGHDCEASRETVWSIYVDTKIDPRNTVIDSILISTGPSGLERWKFTFTPKDSYGNFLGPGRNDGFIVTGAFGNVTIGDLKDLGNGSYEAIVDFDPSSGGHPGITIDQADTPTTVFCPPKDDKPTSKFGLLCWLLILFLILIIILLLIFK
ncbi:VWA domain-containing protein [Ulvibacter antarcticus]|uniref:Trypsin-like peptidase n=1 Tax=Ulvibacter antarcticus TaxID=442714 RepID=A0A3L9Z377_9FLAO|nr:VWA domain-containing protein [Ulvibacter antarcticus]RMA65879.1 trypsin-like peptidase [Ulvibacter antarcticus]